MPLGGMDPSQTNHSSLGSPVLQPNGLAPKFTHLSKVTDATATKALIEGKCTENKPSQEQIDFAKQLLAGLPKVEPCVGCGSESQNQSVSKTE